MEKIKRFLLSKKFVRKNIGTREIKIYLEGEDILEIYPEGEDIMDLYFHGELHYKKYIIQIYVIWSSYITNIRSWWSDILARVARFARHLC